MPGKILKDVLSLLPVGCDEGAFIRAWRMSELERPACVYAKVCGVDGDGCGGCRVAGGLYLRCGKVQMSGSIWCKTCHANMVSDGRPKHGIFSERVSKQDWRTDEGKAPITYMQYLKSKGMSRADGEEFLGESASIVPEHEWELPIRGRRGSAASDTSSEGGRGKFTSRFLPTDEYKGISPPKDKAHMGKNGKILRVYKYTDGSVRKIGPANWTDEANEKFIKLYGGDGANEGFEEAKKKRGKKHVNDEALEQMDEMRAMLEQMKAERDAAQAALAAKDGEQKTQVPVVDEAAEEKAKADKKAKLKAEKAKKKAEKLAKKKAEAAEALKKQQEELKRQQEELQKQMAATEEMSEEEDSDEDEAFDSDCDSDEEEVVFNGYEHNGTLYHLDEDTQELSTEDGEYFGYIDEEGEVHEGDKPEDE